MQHFWCPYIKNLHVGVHIYNVTQGPKNARTQVKLAICLCYENFFYNILI